MTTDEMPTMNMVNYSSNSYIGDFLPQQLPDWVRPQQQICPSTNFDQLSSKIALLEKTVKTQTTEEKPMPVISKHTRIVRVYIADPDTKVPLHQRLLCTGEEQLTEDTDQELFYGLPIKEALEKHNEVRTKTLDKQATAKIGRDVFLEPIKIRDLVMTVVEIASF